MDGAGEDATRGGPIAFTMDLGCGERSVRWSLCGGHSDAPRATACRVRRQSSELHASLIDFSFGRSAFALRRIMHESPLKPPKYPFAPPCYTVREHDPALGLIHVSCVASYR